MTLLSEFSIKFTVGIKNKNETDFKQSSEKKNCCVSLDAIGDWHDERMNNFDVE